VIFKSFRKMWLHSKMKRENVKENPWQVCVLVPCREECVCTRLLPGMFCEFWSLLFLYVAINWVEAIRKSVYFITSNIFNCNINETFLRDRLILTWIRASEISEHLLTVWDWTWYLVIVFVVKGMETSVWRLTKDWKKKIFSP